MARVAISVTTLIGLVFMALQSYEYRDHWKTLTPFSDSYGSIFYTITSFHALHVLVGILSPWDMSQYCPNMVRRLRLPIVPTGPWRSIGTLWTLSGSLSLFFCTSCRTCRFE